MKEEEFGKIVANNKVVFVDFSASWCGPCKMMEPVIEEIEKEFSKIEILKVDVDESPDVAQKYNIMSVPTFLFFDQGKMIDRVSGAVPKDLLASKLKELGE